MDSIDDIRMRLEVLKADLEELKSSIPAHSTSIHHIAQIEDMEEAIADLERRLGSG